jgi:hypothetical protein
MFYNSRPLDVISWQESVSKGAGSEVSKAFSGLSGEMSRTKMKSFNCKFTFEE